MGNINSFEIGDIVICEQTNRTYKRAYNLFVGSIWEITELNNGLVKVKGINDFMPIEFFQLHIASTLKAETKVETQNLQEGDYVANPKTGLKAQIRLIADKDNINNSGGLIVWLGAPTMGGSGVVSSSGGHVGTSRSNSTIKMALLSDGQEFKLDELKLWIDPTYNWSPICDDLWDKYTLD